MIKYLFDLFKLISLSDKLLKIIEGSVSNSNTNIKEKLSFKIESVFNMKLINNSLNKIIINKKNKIKQIDIVDIKR